MTKLTLEAPVDTRTDEERAAAAPLDLPAGGYNHEALVKAAEVTEPDKRAEAIAEANQTETKDLGTPGYTRVEVEDRELGITENRLVATPAPEAPSAVKDPSPPVPPKTVSTPPKVTPPPAPPPSPPVTDKKD